MEEVRSYWQVASISHFCNLFGKPFKLPQFEPEELEQAFILDVPIPPEQKLTINNHSSSSSNNNNNNNNLNQNGLKQHPTIKEEQEEDEEIGVKQEKEVDGDEEIDRKNIDSNDNDNKTNHLDNHDCSDQEQQPEQKQNHNHHQQQDDLASNLEHKQSSDINNHISSSYNINDNSNTSLKFRDHFSNSTTVTSYNSSNKFLHQEDEENSKESQQQQNQQQPTELHLLVKLAIALIKPHFNTKITHLNWETYLKRLVDFYWIGLEFQPSPFTIPQLTQTGEESFKEITFNELPLSDKIELFYALCDYRFWCEDAAEAIKDYTIDELRLESIGKDSQGYEYWYFSGTRLYRENKQLSQDLIVRKTRILELENKLSEFEKNRILKQEEEKKKAELERAKQLAAEAREAKLAAKRQQQEQETQSKRRKSAILDLPPRTGLRERRSSATCNNTNNNNSQRQQQQPEQQSSRATRSRMAKANQPDESNRQQQQQQATATRSNSKPSRGSSRNSKHNDKESTNKKGNSTPEPPRVLSEEDCKAELEKLSIKIEDRIDAWAMHCDSLEDWESFAVKFEKTKSTNEKYLSNHVNEHILPKIRAIYAKRAAEIRRKEKELMLSLTSRRVSTRIISKKTQEEEEERLALIHEAELRRKKEEAEMRLRAELEREIRIRQNRFVINGGTTTTSSTYSDDGEEYNGRYKTRHTNSIVHSNGLEEFDGIIHPDNLSDFYEAIELVIDTVRTSKHAWPFVDPVPETVPGYYDLIEQPMDLRKLRTKIEFREYRSLIELEKDFQLLVNNCERFNGPKNVYTKMVYKLWKSFRKNVRLYLERDLNMDEYKTFIYPPPPKLAPPPQEIVPEPSPQPQTEPSHTPTSMDPSPQPEVETSSLPALETEISTQPEVETLPQLETNSPATIATEAQPDMNLHALSGAPSSTALEQCPGLQSLKQPVVIDIPQDIEMEVVDMPQMDEAEIHSPTSFFFTT